MISLKCPKCGFFFSAWLPDDITAEEEFKQRLLDAPTIEAEAVRHGKWIEPEGVEIAITCICSECKKEFPMWAKKDYDYCPNCGARMDGE